MNSVDFTIVESEFVIALENAIIDVCSPNDAVYNFTYSTFLGFTGITTFSANNLPEGALATFNPTTANADGTPVTLTISGIGEVLQGAFSFQIVGTSGSLTKSAELSLTVYNTNFNALILTAPSDGAVEESISPNLIWNEASNAASYDLQMATDSAFTNIIVEENITTITYALNLSLEEFTTYYWRVKPRNSCGEGTYSSTYSFTTESCNNTCISFGETTWDTSTTLVQFNTINNISKKPSGYGDYTAINTVVKLNESHDLTVNVNTDGSYRVQVKAWIDWNQNCSFDDDGEEYDLGFAYETVDDPTDLSPLSITVPSGANIGNTVMRVSSRYTNSMTYPTSCMEDFDGEVEDYTIIVEDVTASIDDVSFEGFNLYPNPTKGEFTLNLEVINTAKVSAQLYDVRGRLIDEKEYFNTNTNFSERILFEKASAGLYLLKVTNGNKQTTRKLMIR